jgi:hypothetical protein
MCDSGLLFVIKLLQLTFFPPFVHLMVEADRTFEVYYNLNIPVMMHRVHHNNFIIDYSQMHFISS